MKITLIALSTLLATNIMAQSAGGGDRGHGGDPVAQEFTTASNIALEYAKYSIGRDITTNDYQALQESVKTTKVFASDNKLCTLQNCQEGIEFTVLNVPWKNTIQVNKSKWNTLTWDQKLLMAIHEHMGITGLERDNYSLSSKVLDNRRIRTPKKLPVFMVEKITLTLRKEVFVPANTTSFFVTFKDSQTAVVSYNRIDRYYYCEFKIRTSNLPRILRIGRKIELDTRTGGLEIEDDTNYSYKTSYNEISIQNMKCLANAEDPFFPLQAFFEVDAWQGQITDG